MFRKSIQFNPQSNMLRYKEDSTKEDIIKLARLILCFLVIFYLLSFLYSTICYFLVKKVETTDKNPVNYPIVNIKGELQEHFQGVLGEITQINSKIQNFEKKVKLYETGNRLLKDFENIPDWEVLKILQINKELTNFDFEKFKPKKTFAEIFKIETVDLSDLLSIKNTNNLYLVKTINARISFVSIIPFSFSLITISFPRV